MSADPQRATMALVRGSQSFGVVSAMLAAACSMSLGPALGRTMSQDETTYTGASRITAMVQPGRERGLAIGFEHDIGWRLGDAPLYAPDEWRTGLIAGYAKTPKPYTPPVGFEAYGLVGLGQYPIPDRAAPAFAFGPRFGLPIRFGERREPWDAEFNIGATWLLVPTLGAAFYVPLTRGESHTPRTELSASLSLRLHLWSALLP